MPASTSGRSRARSRTRWPAIASRICSRSASVSSSVEPRTRKRTLSQRPRAIWRRVRCPRRYEARAKWITLDPSIRVLSRSKKAAARGTRPRLVPPSPAAARAAAAGGRGREPAVACWRASLAAQLLDREHDPLERRVGHGGERRVPRRYRRGDADEAADVRDAAVGGGVADAQHDSSCGEKGEKDRKHHDYAHQHEEN